MTVGPGEDQDWPPASPEPDAAQESSRNVRASLLRAAGAILAGTDDPADLTVARVTSAAGVSPAALYRHFDSLQELAVTVTLGAYGDRGRELELELRRVDDPSQRLVRRLESRIDWALGAPALYRTLWHAFRGPCAVEPFRSASSLRDLGIGPLLDDVAAVIGEERRGAGLPPDAETSAARAAALWTHFHGYVTNVLYHGTKDLPPEPELRRVFLRHELDVLKPLRREPPGLQSVTARPGPHGVTVLPEPPRDPLLDAARQILLTTQTTEALTIRTLATQAGTSPGSVYRRFPDRQAILLEVAEQDRLRWQTLADGELKRVSDPLDRVILRLRLDLGWALEHPAQFQVLWRGERPPSAHRFDQGALDQRDGWRPYVADISRAAGMSGPGSKALAFAVWADLHGFLSLTLVMPELPWPPAMRLYRAFLEMEYAALGDHDAGRRTRR